MERNARLLPLFSLATLIAGCGSTYRPVVSSTSPVGPAGQPTKYAVAISTTGPSSPGLATIVDFSGDDVLVTAAIGDNPYFLALDTTGSYGYTLNGDGTINSFGVTSSLIESQVNQSTLPANSNPGSITSQGPSLYITQPGLSLVGQLSAGLAPSIKQELPTGAGSVDTVAANQAPRAYVLVQNGVGAGLAYPVETGTQTLDNPIAVGSVPVYGVMTADTRRAFIMNKGSNSVTVINAQSNAVDTFTSPTPGTIPVGVAPVWADFAPPLNEMLVANQGDGINPGTVSVVSIPLCSSTTVLPSPTCDPNNPVDASGFGTVIATITVGVNPQQIAILQDGSLAYVSNQGVLGSTASPGSVSVIDLNSNTVVATIPAAASTDPADATVHGHPGFIAVTTGTPTGKVYVAATDSNDLTVVRTDTNAVQTHLSLQGKGIMVRVNRP